MKDYSRDIEFEQMRNAIHADFLHIKECLAIYKGITEAKVKYVTKDKKYKVPGYKPFSDFIKDSMDHIIIIHLWNLIGNKKTNKHNLKSYMKNIKGNVNDYVKTFLRYELDEDFNGFDNPTQKVLDDIEKFEKHYVSLSSSKNGFYDRLENWRNKIFAHFDQVTETGRFMPKLKGPGPSQWQNENTIGYDEIEKEYIKLWEYFHAIDRTGLRLNYEPQSIAYEIMKFMINKSEIKIIK